jgi:hypothetical protein
MYKAQALTEDELQKIYHKNVSDLYEFDNCGLTIYSFEEIAEHPERFEQIKDFLRTVDLVHTSQDFKACCIEHGMPAETKTYSYQIINGAYVVRFGDSKMRITREDLDKFTTTSKKTFCVVKRKIIDVDVDGWIAKDLMDALENASNDCEDIDLSYTPICLNVQSCDKLCKILVDMYDKDELYPNAELAKFMLELMRVMCHHDDVFIEFQD